jgi:hypothetical protein
MRHPLSCLKAFIEQFDGVCGLNTESSFYRFCQKWLVKSFEKDLIREVLLFVVLFRSGNHFVSEKLAHINVENYKHFADRYDAKFLT